MDEAIGVPGISGSSDAGLPDAGNEDSAEGPGTRTSVDFDDVGLFGTGNEGSAEGPGIRTNVDSDVGLLGAGDHIAVVVVAVDDITGGPGTSVIVECSPAGAEGGDSEFEELDTEPTANVV